MLSSNVPDDKLMLDKFAEFGLAGGKLPLIGGGGHIGAPELLKVTGCRHPARPDGRPRQLAGSRPGSSWPRASSTRTKEPWFGHDSLFAYVHVLIFKEALERAGVADRHKVAEAIRGLDMRDGPALFFPGHHLKFDAKGRRESTRCWR